MNLLPGLQQLKFNLYLSACLKQEMLYFFSLFPNAPRKDCGILCFCPKMLMCCRRIFLQQQSYFLCRVLSDGCTMQTYCAHSTGFSKGEKDKIMIWILYLLLSFFSNFESCSLCAKFLFVKYIFSYPNVCSRLFSLYSLLQSQLQ